MRILVTGAGGQLGLELKDVLARDHEVVALTRKQLDIADAPAVERALEEHGPELVVNAAAYTDVDGCETEPDLAYRVNALGPRNLAQHGERRGCEVLHVSTNYVFDGEKEEPYEPFDLPVPISVYGLTKLAGEEYVKHLSTRWYLVRTASVYGEGHNFVRKMLRMGRERDVLKVKEDEFVSLTYARDLAEGIAAIVETRLYGLYHVTNAGSCSWYEFAREILTLAGVEVEVIPIPGVQYPLPAARPVNGVISGPDSPDLRHWREAIVDYLAREGELGETGWN
jgi:dTDP-4-dehydrorhamnose reductase